MNKFEQFLDDTATPNKKMSHSVTDGTQAKSVTSVKINQSTLNDLSVLKLLMNQKSYAGVIDVLVQRYLTDLTDEQKQLFDQFKEMNS